MQNHLDEFFAMVDFCNPGVLGLPAQVGRGGGEASRRLFGVLIFSPFLTPTSYAAQHTLAQHLFSYIALLIPSHPPGSLAGFADCPVVRYPVLAISPHSSVRHRSSGSITSCLFWQGESPTPRLRRWLWERIAVES